MPRFKFDTGVALKDTLAAMGMPEAFSPGGADFSGINGGRDLSVQAVIHKAIIAVDEKGTTAAAATGVVVGTTSVPPQLRADRPFLFFIRHDPTGAILFQGRVGGSLELTRLRRLALSPALSRKREREHDPDPVPSPRGAGRGLGRGVRRYGSRGRGNAGGCRCAGEWPRWVTAAAWCTP